MRRILDASPEARRRIPGLVATDPNAWESAQRAIEDSALSHVIVGSIWQLGQSLETAERQLRTTLLSGAGTASAKVLSEAPSYQAWRGRLTLMSQLEHGLAHGDCLCGAIAKGCPSSARLSDLVGSIRRTEAARVAAGRRLSLPAIPGLEDLERLEAILGPRASALGRLWAFATSKDYRKCRAMFKSMVRLPVKRREWDAEIRGAIELRTAERALAANVAEWGYTRDAGGVDALEAGCNWLAGIERTAQGAQIPTEVVWEIMRERRDPALEGTEKEIGALSAALVRDGQLLQSMNSIAGAGEFRLQRFLNALTDVASAANLAARQSSAWQVEREMQLGAVIALGVAAARALELETACASDSEARELVGAEYAGVDSAIGQLELVWAWHSTVMNHPSTEWKRTISKILTERSTAPERMATLKESATLIALSARTATQLCVDASAAFEMRGPASKLMLRTDKSLSALAYCLRTLREHQASIPKVFRHHCAAMAARSLVGKGLVDKYLDGTVDCARITESFQASTYRHALESDGALAPLVDFDRARMDRCLTELRDTDAELRSVNAAVLRGKLAARKAPAGVDIGRVRDKTQLALIRHVVQTPKARLDLTGLYGRAGAAMRELQPCTIATPTTVSEYLPRQVADFDLVIIDEASQVEPASAIGAIARGAQVIIVGDPKQLPPTNFFGGARVVGSEGELEDPDDPGDGVADAESILDRAIGSLNNVYLRGHYRSKHHSLIDYSNRHFYDSQLVVPPSTAPRSSQIGVVAHHVKDAYYSASENEVEAKAVAEAVIRHLRQSPGESLGVVAFNARQADLIERHITALARRSREDFEAYAKACDADTPLFIRNLESVQGDERDVIFISYTYGRDPVAKVVHQRFGPLTQQGGGRRLNVLVTRARSRVEVFHSLEPTDITGQSGGVPLMRAYLQHAMRDAQHDFSEGTYESAFEERVAAIIAEINPSLVVRPQVGCEGFRIDLGVALQSAPHRFILGIECDGAAYHSEPSARQRDMIRQAILEQHGWTIHRIWSTAWWHNFTEERARLSKAINQAIAARR
jgi:very-short-patch-repair endonuclease